MSKFNVYMVISDNATNQNIEYASIFIDKALEIKAHLEQLEFERQERHKKCFDCFKKYIGLKIKPPLACYSLSQFDTCENEVVADTEIKYDIRTIEVNE